MNTNSNLSCVILAGGRSRRMGKDKALLSLPDGQSLLSQTVEVARSLSPHILISTPWPERYQAALSSPQPPAVQWIVDEQAAGPLVGFLQAWSYIKTDWCLLLACDLPNLNAQVLRQWWEWLAAQDASSFEPSASLAPGSKGWEPLCGYYHCRCDRAIAKHLESDLELGDSSQERPSRRSFQSWLSTLEIAPYTDVPDEMLFNCNTPSDWATIQDE